MKFMRCKEMTMDNTQQEYSTGYAIFTQEHSINDKPTAAEVVAYERAIVQFYFDSMNDDEYKMYKILRRGGAMTSAECGAALWGEEKPQPRFTSVALKILKTMESKYLVTKNKVGNGYVWNV